MKITLFVYSNTTKTGSGRRPRRKGDTHCARHKSRTAAWKNAVRSGGGSATGKQRRNFLPLRHLEFYRRGREVWNQDGGGARALPSRPRGAAYLQILIGRRRRGCRPFKEQITTFPSTAGVAAAPLPLYHYMHVRIYTVSLNPPLRARRVRRTHFPNFSPPPRPSRRAGVLRE